MATEREAVLQNYQLKFVEHTSVFCLFQNFRERDRKIAQKPQSGIEPETIHETSSLTNFKTKIFVLNEVANLVITCYILDHHLEVQLRHSTRKYFREERQGFLSCASVSGQFSVIV